IFGGNQSQGQNQVWELLLDLLSEKTAQRAMDAEHSRSLECKDALVPTPRKIKMKIEGHHVGMVLALLVCQGIVTHITQITGKPVRSSLDNAINLTPTGFNLGNLQHLLRLLVVVCLPLLASQNALKYFEDIVVIVS